MPYTLFADIVVLVHLCFVGFVFLGGLLVWRWPGLAWVHAPAALWGATIEWTGGICPLTPLENWLRSQGGEVGYATDFVAQYLLPLLYPAGLTRATQLVLGGLVLVVNGAAYGWIWVNRRAHHV